ncbi:hypothetical protein WBJ53_14365 [Spirosoma sp. SC4-14]|uniref:hypothetical protein n=1 Tax=Spirosoma sp. SC4-14 TaxID=3128900 RepID=UPI0030D454EF
MKTVLKLVGGLILLVLMKPAFAQDHPVAYIDPTYSTHNYKQMNKASVAQHLEHTSGVSVPATSAKEALWSDYKPQVRQGESDGGINIDYKASTDMASWNYKTQHVVHASHSMQPKHKHEHHHKAA